jgi:hypothetical protein
MGLLVGTQKTRMLIGTQTAKTVLRGFQMGAKTLLKIRLEAIMLHCGKELIYPLSLP